MEEQYIQFLDNQVDKKSLKKKLKIRGQSGSVKDGKKEKNK